MSSQNIKGGDEGPLAHCIVVDPRFSSRKEVLENLRSLGMFKSVIEAKSVAHALTLLRDLGSEACVVGPTITQEALDDFLDKASDVADECVFLGFAPEGSESPSHERLHATLNVGATKEQLSETISKAFAAAGKTIQLPRKVTVNEAMEDKPVEPKSSKEAEPLPARKPFTLGDMTTGDERLRLLWDFARANKRLNPLPPAERKALDEILDGLTSGIADKSKSDKFRAHAENAFQGFGEWASSLSLIEALNELRSTLIRTWK